MASPIIVTGMHRSGTSLVASFLSALGLDLGEELVAPDAANPRGYYEDSRFVELHRRILRAATPEDDGGHRDWGWTEGEALDRQRFLDFRRDALELVEGCNSNSALWGWKDPRTTLLLDFWEEILNQPKFVLLYRFPWDVADSMQRLGADVFLEEPEYAYRIWEFYNRDLIEFYQKHSDRAVLANTNAVLRKPEAFVAALEERLDVELAETSLEKIYEPDSFVTLEGSDPLIALVAQAWPSCVELVSRLDDAADLGGVDLWQRPSPKHFVAAPAARAASPVDLTVVLPCFNDGAFLIEAVASVERSFSSSARCEMIIVDDGSSEARTLEILEILETAGYHLLRCSHGGLPAARNRGIEAARGRYILPLDADNRLRRGFVEAALEVLDAAPEVGVVYGDCWEFGKRCGCRRPPDLRLSSLVFANYIDACAVFRKDVWSQVGGYDTALRFLEDWEFWINVSKHGWRFHRLPNITFDYRVRPNSLVSEGEDPAKLLPVIRHVVGKHQELYDEYITERLGALAGWFAALQRENVELATRSQGLQQELEGLNQRLCERDGEIATHRQELLAWDKKMTVATEQLAVTNHELATANDELAVTNEELATANDELAVTNEELATANDELATAREELAQRHQEVASLEQAVEKRAQELSVRHRELAASKEEVTNLETSLAARTATVAERDGEIARNQEELAAQETRIQGLLQEVGRLGQELSITRQEASELELSLMGQAERVERQQTVLDEIHGSLGWRLAARYWRSIERLLPPSTRRRRIYDRVLGRFKG